MSNTVITNYTDLNGPSTKADSSVVVIVNKDGSLSVDEKVLGTLMSNDRSQGAGISVVRLGHDGRPDDATDSDTENDDIPHVTLSVDSYYDEPNSIIKYDSGADMLHSLRIETRENSLVGFQNDHCYTSLTSPSQSISQRSEICSRYDEPIIEIKTPQLSKPIPSSKKITILEQQIIPKGRKIIINPSEAVLLKGNDILSKPLLKFKSKRKERESINALSNEDNIESSSISSSGDSVLDRDSDSDYKEAKDKISTPKTKKIKQKPRILKNNPSKIGKDKIDFKYKIKSSKNLIRKEIKDKILYKNINLSEKKNVMPSKINQNEMETENVTREHKKETPKQIQKVVKKEKKTPAHVSALLSDMTSLFSSPDVIRRVSTDTKPSLKPEKIANRKSTDEKEQLDHLKNTDSKDKVKEKMGLNQKTYTKQKDKLEKDQKGFELMPQIDDVSLAQILQDTTGLSSTSIKQQTTNPAIIKDSFATGNITMNSPNMAGPLSPTLDLLGGLQPEEEGLTEDLLMHVAQLVESSENLQEVIDKQVLGKVEGVPSKANVQTHFQQVPQSSNVLYSQATPLKTPKVLGPRKDPIEIVRRDGRVITLPPIEAPATRSSKRKSQMTSNLEPTLVHLDNPVIYTPEQRPIQASKQYINKKLSNKKQEGILSTATLPITESSKVPLESEDSLNSEDDPNRLWCICKQPHNNRFMICCDSCEDWFHGKCVNITKAMGQQMEEQGIEWTCPNCIKKVSPATKSAKAGKMNLIQRKLVYDEEQQQLNTPRRHSAEARNASAKTGCIVCKKAARASSIYCSDECILKHAQDSLNTQPSPNKTDNVSGKGFEKSKVESRVIVFERKTGRCLAGPNAPTAENLKAWLQKNPTFEVVRPGTLSATKPMHPIKKALNEPHKIQTTLNFEKLPRKSLLQTPTSQSKIEAKELNTPIKEETKQSQIAKFPATQKQTLEMPKTPITPKTPTETKKPARPSLIRSQSSTDKAPVSPIARRKEKEIEKKGRNNNSTWPIRDNVRKALQEQMSLRMPENDGPKFTEDEIKQFAIDTEIELHELFKDVGMKYKAKYRSLMFNIKDRKNLSLWQKICDKSITPKQLVRLSPEELASQELAEWRDNEAKHQLELIKKSELDLLAANKTYVLKTHKGEEVMQPKTSVSTELDPNVPVEDLVTALNDSTTADEPSPPGSPETKTSTDLNKSIGRKKKRENSGTRKKDTKTDSSNRRSRSTRKSSQKEKERSIRRSGKRSSRIKSNSKDKSYKKKSNSREHSRHRSRSRVKPKCRSKSREHSRSREHSSKRERSKSRSHSKLRSRSRERRSVRNKRRFRSKQRAPSMDKDKHRSRSHENDNNKNKNDTRSSDVIERPKSALMREVHPEYDPHEPMITSAFSEEDLRKSKDDVSEDTYNNDCNIHDVSFKDYSNSEYDPEKAFSLDTASGNKNEGKPDKVSEGESDQEPSSTVDSSAVTVWNGCINMVDVARFYVAAHEVSGNGTELEEDLHTELDIVGRINPDTVWDYINKMKKAGNKDIIVLRLTAANDEEKMQYIALYSYLSSRNRLGVVKVPHTSTVKDFYILPLSSSATLPTVLLPLNGPGLEEAKTHLLIAIVIRQRKKRTATAIPKDVIPAKVSRESRTRSYTPPVVKSSYTPPTSPRRRAALPLPYTSPALSTSVKDKIAASLACADDEEAYSPGSSSSNGSVPASTTQPATNVLRSKMEELNRQIEEQKQQIRKMTRGESSVSEDEAYSPSRPMTPPPVVPLADISLPSNLQEILATIKQRTEASGVTGDVDMRTYPPT